MRRGFTLIEAILTVALISVLLFMLAPSLSRVRESARTTANLSNLRQHVAIVSAYATDYSGLVPQLAEPTATYSVIRCESQGVALAVPYFAVTRYWHIGLADGYYAGEWKGRSFHSPWIREPGVQTSYVLSCTMMADPAFYNLSTRLDLPHQLRAARLDEVQFPSNKAMLASAESYRTSTARDTGYLAMRQATTDVGMVDGHAEHPKAESVVPQIHNGDGPFSVADYGGHMGALLPMTHTERGVRGRDIK